MTTHRKFTPQQIRDAVEAAMAVKSDHPFHWPDDGVVCQPWSYDFHCGWVGAWNAEGRVTPAEDFIRSWMTDENLAVVIAQTEENQA